MQALYPVLSPASVLHSWSLSDPQGFFFFFFLQLDTEYRKKWDALVIKLDVIERDVISGSEVLHWVTHFPVSIFTLGSTFIITM